MELAYRMASRAIGSTSANPAVGCVIVKNDNIISRGWTQPGGKPHAEIHAIEGLFSTPYYHLSPLRILQNLFLL